MWYVIFSVQAIYPFPELLTIIFLSPGSALVFLIYMWPKPTLISPGGSIPLITPNTPLSLSLHGNYTTGIASSIIYPSVP